MAQQLARAGREVPLVVILDTPSPEHAGDMASTDEIVQLVMLAHEEAIKAGRQIVLTTDELRPLDREGAVARTLEVLREAELLPGDVEVELVYRLLDGYRARCEALARYDAAVYPGRLVLFVPSETLEGFGEPEGFGDRTGWSPYTTEPLRVETVPGHHATMASGPRAVRMAERLRAVVDDALGA
jgi:thioesterase domain-containing protein